MTRFLVLVGFGAVALFFVLRFLFSALLGSSEKSCTKKMQRAVETARRHRDNIWKEAKNIEDMVVLYMRMVAKHGPDSEEAKAFRFGTGSRLMKELHEDHEAMAAFGAQANIIDETYRRIRKRA